MCVYACLRIRWPAISSAPTFISEQVQHRRFLWRADLFPTPFISPLHTFILVYITLYLHSKERNEDADKCEYGIRRSEGLGVDGWEKLKKTLSTPVSSSGKRDFFKWKWSDGSFLRQFAKVVEVVCVSTSISSSPIGGNRLVK